MEFLIDAKGNPTDVEAKVLNDGFDMGIVPLVKVNQVGSRSTWKGRYFAPNDTPVGTKIYFDLTAKILPSQEVLEVLKNLINFKG